MESTISREREKIEITVLGGNGSVCMKNDSFLNGGCGRKTVFQLPSNAIYHIMKGEKIM